jgi:hypothetical protein
LYPPPPPDKWQYNFNYWTGGAQRDCKGQWTWCAGTEKIVFHQDLAWAYNQPDNKAGGDDCIHMKLLQNKTGIVLSDRNCSDKYIIACEVPVQNIAYTKIPHNTYHQKGCTKN